MNDQQKEGYKLAGLLSKARYEIAVAAISLFGSGFLFVIYDKLENKYLLIGMTVLLVLLVSSLIFTKLKRDTERDSFSSELSYLKDEINKISAVERDEATNLLVKTVHNSTSVIRHMSDYLQALAKRYKESPAAKTIVDKELINSYAFEFKYDIIQRVLRCIVDTFESDNRGLDTTTYPHNYFKVALFEKKENSDGKIYLLRTQFYYPVGVEPNASTEKVYIENHPRAAHVLSYINNEIIIIEDISSEKNKRPDETRWVDLRFNQYQGYKSMICIPIVRGKRGTRSRTVLGVIVIDTNREKYFKEQDSSYKAFLGSILSPYRTLLTLSFDIKRFVETAVGT